MTDWLMIIGLILLYIIAISWIGILFGLIAGETEGAGALAALVAVLPYLSSGVAPTETMPAAVRIFSENQPLTPIIESLRALFGGQSAGDDLWIAIAGCIGILAVSQGMAVRRYRTKNCK